jgi:hypothetical protein
VKRIINSGGNKTTFPPKDRIDIVAKPDTELFPKAHFDQSFFFAVIVSIFQQASHIIRFTTSALIQRVVEERISILVYNSAL